MKPWQRSVAWGVLVLVASGLFVLQVDAIKDEQARDRATYAQQREQDLDRYGAALAIANERIEELGGIEVPPPPVPPLPQPGADGEDGEDGRDGRDGRDGEDGTDGLDGTDGTDGKPGKDGSNGKDGLDAPHVISVSCDVTGIPPPYQFVFTFFFSDDTAIQTSCGSA